MFKNYAAVVERVLNLIINGIPSILKDYYGFDNLLYVLNLIINGIPSILNLGGDWYVYFCKF